MLDKIKLKGGFFATNMISKRDIERDFQEVSNLKLNCTFKPVKEQDADRQEKKSLKHGEGNHGFLSQNW